eukprot:scaffold14877_cov63-Isochrysis_galbana.AAC.2
MSIRSRSMHCSSAVGTSGDAQRGRAQKRGLASVAWWRDRAEPEDSRLTSADTLAWLPRRDRARMLWGEPPAYGRPLSEAESE